MAAGAFLLKDPESTVFEKVRVASQAYTIGDIVMLDRVSDAIDVVPATSSTTTTNLYGVAVQTVASSATELMIAVITPKQEWLLQSANDAVVNNKFQRMLLTDANTVNNTGTDNTTKEAVFMQTGYQGALTAKVLVGKFLKVANVTA